VDDNPGFISAAGNLLTREGVSVVGVAYDGDGAVERVTELRPDVALVDINLENESGFDVAKRLTELPEAATPVILISSYSERDFADLIASSPALGFVSKADLSADAIEKLIRSNGAAPS
jgi:CheY-like chemotaxis protein